MRILFIGDIFGQPGRRMVRETLPLLREELQPDLVLANAENAAAGFGITPPLVEELLDLDIAVLTSGNHIWDKKEIYPISAIRSTAVCCGLPTIPRTLPAMAFS